MRAALAASVPRSSDPGPASQRRSASAWIARGLASGLDSSMVTSDSSVVTSGGAAVASPSGAAASMPSPPSAAGAASAAASSRVLTSASSRANSSWRVSRRAWRARTSASRSASAARSRAFSRRSSFWLEVWASAGGVSIAARQATSTSSAVDPPRAVVAADRFGRRTVKGALGIEAAPSGARAGGRRPDFGFARFARGPVVLPIPLSGSEAVPVPLGPHLPNLGRIPSVVPSEPEGGLGIPLVAAPRGRWECPDGLRPLFLRETSRCQT